MTLAPAASIKSSAPVSSIKSNAPTITSSAPAISPLVKQEEHTYLLEVAN